MGAAKIWKAERTAERRFVKFSRDVGCPGNVASRFFNMEWVTVRKNRNIRIRYSRVSLPEIYYLRLSVRR
jgi:hypothetical protein